MNDKHVHEVMDRLSPSVFAGLLSVNGILTYANKAALDATERNSRGRVLAVYGVVVYGAWAASQPLLNLSAPSGFVLFCLVSICLSLALVPIFSTFCGRPRSLLISPRFQSTITHNVYYVK